MNLRRRKKLSLRYKNQNRYNSSSKLQSNPKRMRNRRSLISSVKFPSQFKSRGQAAKNKRKSLLMKKMLKCKKFQIKTHGRVFCSNKQPKLTEIFSRRTSKSSLSSLARLSTDLKMCGKLIS